MVKVCCWQLKAHPVIIGRDNKRYVGRGYGYWKKVVVKLLLPWGTYRSRSMIDCVESTIEKYGKIDGVVNNADQ